LRAVTGSPVLLHEDFKDFKVNNVHWTRENQLLVLDWGFAWSGPRLMDVGQVVRWNPPAEFVRAFARSYREHGGHLPDEWERWAALFDVFNLVGSVERVMPGERRREDTKRRLRATVDAG
jgi:aminoglycoside phosphotransferase (APT) family kinase protein